MGFDRDFAVRLQGKRLSNGSKNQGQLSGLEHGGRSTTNVHGSQGTSPNDVLGRVEAKLDMKGAEKRVSGGFTVKFEVEGAKMTALPAEGYVQI
jgi:hypothetical protein